MTGACAGAVVVALIPLALVLAYIASKGIGSLDLAFFTQLPKPHGETGGGMANAIVGSLKLIGMAAALAVPVGILSGIYIAEYPGSPLAWLVRLAADVLNGIPSIVVGIFAYGLVVLPMRRFSAIAGAVALAIMMVPIVTRTTEELIKLGARQHARSGSRARRDARAGHVRRHPARRLPGDPHRHPRGRLARSRERRRRCSSRPSTTSSGRRGSISRPPR